MGLYWVSNDSVAHKKLTQLIIVDTTHERKTTTKITGIDYGYLWWNIPHKVNEITVVSKMATENGGQYIMVIPEMDMVAVFTGGE